MVEIYIQKNSSPKLAEVQIVQKKFTVFNIVSQENKTLRTFYSLIKTVFLKSNTKPTSDWESPLFIAMLMVFQRSTMCSFFAFIFSYVSWQGCFLRALILCIAERLEICKTKKSAKTITIWQMPNMLCVFN